ncbi:MULTISPECIES: hypothetical protein [Salimicrobium]|uniref:hypothetical protein n=1 Tax=Salimicrobium TaxID=351195 RepID=UPI0013564AC8|nr:MULTISPECIES: hypothetical protein [Salimicrobium]MBM7695210.1 hypothetical protein [Salimicrobium jeotgali]
MTKGQKPDVQFGTMFFHDCSINNRPGEPVYHCAVLPGLFNFVSVSFSAEANR